MNRVTKLLALLLAVMMVMPMLMACGGDPGETSGKTSETSSASDVPSQKSEYAELPEGLRFDENGEPTEMRFIVADDIGLGFNLAGRSICVDEDADVADTVNSAIVRRNQTVEDKLGVKITLLDTVGLMDMAKTIQPSLLGGSDDYDIIGAYQYYAPMLTIGENAGFMINYNALTEEDNYLDFSKPYWNEDLFNEMSYKGAGYFVTGDLCLSYIGGMYVTFVNERIWNLYAEKIKELTGFTDVYEMVNAGKWTIDVMTELTKTAWIDENQNDKVDEGDQAGYMMVYGDSNIDGLYAGCGIKYTEWVDGEPTMAAYTERNLEIASKLYTLYYETPVLNDGDSENYLMQDWAEGNCLFITTRLYNSELYLRDMTDNYYIIPCPKLNEEQEDYCTTLHDGFNLYCIPFTNSKLAATTATLELMGSESYRTVTPAYYETALKTKYTRGDVDKASAMIDRIHDSVSMDFVALYTQQIGGVTLFFRDNLTKRFASQVKSHEKMWSNGLKKTLQNLTDYLDIDLR